MNVEGLTAGKSGERAAGTGMPPPSTPDREADTHPRIKELRQQGVRPWIELGD